MQPFRFMFMMQYFYIKPVDYSKLDQALTQQARVVQQTRNAAEQRRQTWLKMQTKRKALETLVAQAQQREQHKVDKQQQQLADEYAAQRFYQRTKQTDYG